MLTRNSDAVSAATPKRKRKRAAKVRDAIGKQPHASAAVKAAVRELPNCTARAQREAAEEALSFIVNHHRKQKALHHQRSAWSSAEVKRWLKRMVSAAKALADLLENPRNPLGLACGSSLLYERSLLGDLRRVERAGPADLALQTGKFGRSGREPDLATRGLISHLAWLYRQYNPDKPIGFWRAHCHYDLKNPRHGMPGGPFFRFVKATLALAGDARGDEAIASTIKRALTDKRFVVVIEPPPGLSDTTLALAGEARRDEAITVGTWSKLTQIGY
jgi:hypothetical protein